MLSEELQEQTAERLRLEHENAEHDQLHPKGTRSRNAVDWKLIIKLAVAVCGVLAALSVVLPPLGFLVFAWAPVAPAVVISLYVTRARQSHFSAAIGARIGVVCGSLIVLALAVLNTIALVVLRFALHRTDFDNSVNAMITQVRTQTVAQSGAQAADFFGLFAVPEFRAGFFLAGFALMAAFVLLLATGGGALAGSFQKRKRVS